MTDTLSTERKVHDLQVTVSDLFKLRCDRSTADLLNPHVGELFAALGTLRVLCDELRKEIPEIDARSPGFGDNRR